MFRFFSVAECISDRVEQITLKQAYIYYSKRPNDIKYRLINPAKTNIGCITNKAITMMRGKSPRSDVEMSKILNFVTAILNFWRAFLNQF